MAHVPADDARQLFDETNPKTWSQLQKVVQQHKGRAQGISDSLVDLMLAEIPKLEQSGKSFPKTPDELETMLNQELAAMGQGGKP